MRTSIIRFCISLVIILVLVAKQGYAATESFLMTLCPSAHQGIMHACCIKCTHKEAKGLSVKGLKAGGCHCSPVSQDDQPVIFTSSQHDLLPDIITHVSEPTFGLKVADSTLPVWLYKLYHPDKSRLYLENRHLLL